MESQPSNLFESLDLSPVQKDIDKNIRTKAAEFYQAIEFLAGSREKSLAVTKLEETVMWAIKANSRTPR